MLSRKSRKSAGRNQAPARIQPSRRAHRRPDLKLLAEELEVRVLLATDVWTGLSLAVESPSNANWSDANNWLRDGSPGVPTNNDSLVFPAGALQLNNTDNSGTLTLTSITFTGTGYTINSNSGSINLGAGGLSVSPTAGAGTNVFNVTTAFLNPETFTVATSGQVLTDSQNVSGAGFPLTVTGQGNLSLTGVLGGTGTTLVKGLSSSDVGTLALTGANTFSGSTTINAGVLSIGQTTALGNTTTSAVVNSGGTLEITAGDTFGAKPVVLNGPGFLNQGAFWDNAVNATWTGPITINAGTYINVTGSTLTVSGIISNIAGQTGSLNKLGAGTLSLTSAETYSGATTVNAGTLSLTGGTGAIASSTPLAVQNGATLRVDDSSGTAAVTRIPPTAPITLTGGNLFFNPNAAATAETFGPLTLGAGNSIITSSNGTTVGDTTALTFGTLTRNTGATVDFVVPSSSNAQPLGSSFNQITFAGTTLPGQFATTGGFNILPYAIVTSIAGTADFATNLGNNSIGAFTNYVTDLANAATDPNAATDVVKQTQVDPGTVGSSGLTIAALLLAPGVTSIPLGGTLTLGAGALLSSSSGAFAPVISGGTLNFGGSSDGILITADATAITTTIASPITAANGLTIAGYSGTTSGNTNALTSATGNPGITGTVTLDGGTLNMGVSGDLGTGTLNLVGGTLTASAAATIGNPFTLSNNLFNLSNVVTIGGSNAITFLGAGTLSGATSLTVSSGAIFDAPIGESPVGSGAALTLPSTGTTTLNAANTFTGGLTESAGTLTVGNNSALGTGPLLINANATIQSSVAVTIPNQFTFGAISAPVNVTFGNTSNTPLTFSNTGTLIGTALTMTVNNTGGIYFPASLTGVANLTTAGAGTIFLLGNNTYVGGTTIGGTTTVVVNTANSLGTGPLTLTSGTLFNTAPVTFTNLVSFTGGSFAFTTTSYSSSANSNPNPLTFSNTGHPAQRGDHAHGQQ